jgi:hypothetical protein
MSYQCEHDGGEPDPVDCAWCLFDLEARLDRLSRNLAIAGALCAAYERGQSFGYVSGYQDACDSRAGC